MAAAKKKQESNAFFDQFEEGGKFEGEADVVTYLSSRAPQDMDTEVVRIEVKTYENDNEARFGDNYVQAHLKVLDVREGEGYQKIGGDDLNPPIEKGDIITIQESMATTQTKGAAKRSLGAIQRLVSVVSGEPLHEVRKKKGAVLLDLADPTEFAGIKIRITTPKDKQNKSGGITYFNTVLEAI